MVVLRSHALLRAFRMLCKGGNTLDDIKMTESCLYFFKKDTGCLPKIPTLVGKIHVDLQIIREKIVKWKEE